MNLHMRSLRAVIAMAGLAPFAAQAVNAPVAADSYAIAGFPTANYGTATSLKVNGSAKTLLRFDLSVLPDVQSTDVAKASLVLWVSATPSGGTLQVSPVDTPWTEGGLTWNNQPAVGAPVASNIPVAAATSGYYVTVDVTEQVKSWVSGAANDGLIVESQSGPASVLIDSKENTGTSHPAYLDISLNGPAGAATAGPGGPVVKDSAGNTLGTAVDFAGSAYVIVNKSGYFADLIILSGQLAPATIYWTGKNCTGTPYIGADIGVGAYTKSLIYSPLTNTIYTPTGTDTVTAAVPMTYGSWEAYGHQNGANGCGNNYLGLDLSASGVALTPIDVSAAPIGWATTGNPLHFSAPLQIQ